MLYPLFHLQCQLMLLSCLELVTPWTARERRPHKQNVLVGNKHLQKLRAQKYSVENLSKGNVSILTNRHSTWWRHQMETFSALLAICAGNSPAPVNFPHKGQWRGALMFALICVWINAWVNNRKAGDLRRYCAHYDVIVMNMDDDVTDS